MQAVRQEILNAQQVLELSVLLDHLLQHRVLVASSAQEDRQIPNRAALRPEDTALQKQVRGCIQENGRGQAARVDKRARNVMRERN